MLFSGEMLCLRPLFHCYVHPHIALKFNASLQSYAASQLFKVLSEFFTSMSEKRKCV